MLKLAELSWSSTKTWAQLEYRSSTAVRSSIQISVGVDGQRWTKVGTRKVGFPMIASVQVSQLTAKFDIPVRKSGIRIEPSRPTTGGKYGWKSDRSCKETLFPFWASAGIPIETTGQYHREPVMRICRYSCPHGRSPFSKFACGHEWLCRKGPMN